MDKILTPRARLRFLRTELNYHRQMLLIDLRAVRAAFSKIREIAAKMRQVQKEIKA